VTKFFSDRPNICGETWATVDFGVGGRVQVLEDFLGYILLGRLTAQATTLLINSRDGERGGLTET
jgi:hypothetical protein